jgi:hypothetical protein
MDPISIALLLGSSALSGIGALGENAAKNKFLSANLNADMQQLLQDQQAAALRNQELQKYITNANAFGAQNQAALGRGIAAFTPNRLGADTAARGATISKAIGTGPDTNIPMRQGVPNPVSAEFNKQLGDAFARASGQGGRLAAVGGYGDSLGGINRDLSTTGEKIKTTNNLAAGNMALLPGAQDLASFSAYSPIFRPSQPDVPWWASAAKGLGNLGGAAAGWIGSANPAFSSYNTTGGVYFG